MMEVIMNPESNNQPNSGAEAQQFVENPQIAGMYLELLTKWVNYDRIDRYMRGDHQLRFATQKFSNAFGGLFRAFANNYCKRVVNTLADYIQLDKVETADDGVRPELDAWWRRQRMDAQSGRVHADAFKYGDGYVILAPGPGSGGLRLYRQDPRCVQVIYDQEQPERIFAAIKLWQQFDHHWRLNVYLPGRTARLISVGVGKNGPPQNLNGFIPYEADGDSVVISELSVVPVFHFANEPDRCGQGVSELDDIIPLQDALNKSICDMLVGMEFHALPQRWATGIEREIDPDTGKERPINVDPVSRLLNSPSTDVKFGEFSVADLRQFLQVSEAFRMEIARLSRIPVHHLMLVENFPSGEALKTAEHPLMAKIADRSVIWGNVWEDVAAYALAALRPGLQFEDAADALGLNARWKEVSARGEKGIAEANLISAQAATARVALGVPRSQAQRELGYSEEQVALFGGMKDEG
jgi:hypothetical protein